MATDTNRLSILIKSLEKELKKAHMINDALHFYRCTHMYEATTDAVHGTPCILTRYEYDGDTNYVTGVKEEIASWDASWDF